MNLQNILTFTLQIQGARSGVAARFLDVNYLTTTSLACQNQIGSTLQLHTSLLHAQSPNKYSRGSCVVARVSRRTADAIDVQGAATSPPLIDSFRALAGKPRGRAYPGSETRLQCRPSGTCQPRATDHRIFGALQETTLQTLYLSAAKCGGNGTRSNRGFHPTTSRA